MTDTLVVNEHYLNRVVAVAETAGVEAAEDIMSGNGIKLLAKGTRIDANAKERLLQHKLRKPLESSVRVIDGVALRQLDQVAEALLDRHALLASVCGSVDARRVTAALQALRLTSSTESMLSVYAAQGPHKLEHAVGVSLMGASMQHNLPGAGSGDGQQVLMVAGLLHDVGELYIDPAILNARSRLTAEQWKHIAAHPIVAAHLLRDMPGAGPQVAEAVLCHHERLDGFGYPQGLRGTQLPLSGQVLALAEMLMGLIESGRSPAERASVAVKLIPGEFNRHLLARVAQAIRRSATAPAEQEAAPQSAIETLAQRVALLDTTLGRLRPLEDSIEERIRSSSPGLRELMQHTVDRGRRIRLAFSSTGLNTLGPQELRERLAAMDAQVQFEVDIVLREIEWRMHEVKRETRLRLERLPPADAALALQFVEESKDAARSAVQEVASPAVQRASA
ncbi:HD-GYP domain-containing protein [Caldimonas brevitalea]|uniref:HD-GYP domain-containing protein n=1 Tax=Caldimonas brevitalea TaxID=413882 RepID=A0A0G3BCU5_9BURK|nr:HD domain-containing phosphohydrolase [Caldimonas brevitalea]AKJ27209.1 hypothetical protein AAW51_0518 [Caldimonas brevitalea]